MVCQRTWELESHLRMTEANYPRPNFKKSSHIQCWEAQVWFLVIGSRTPKVLLGSTNVEARARPNSQLRRQLSKPHNLIQLQTNHSFTQTTTHLSHPITTTTTQPERLKMTSTPTSLSQRLLQCIMVSSLASGVISTTTCTLTNPIGELVWSDEFDGTSLNTEFWTHNTGRGDTVTGDGWGNDELQEYTTDAVAVDGGALKITASGSPGAYTSGRINTQGKFAFKYGTLEASIKIPDRGLDAGLWPALWMMGTAYGTVDWPNAGKFCCSYLAHFLRCCSRTSNSRRTNPSLRSFVLFKIQAKLISSKWVKVLP